MKHLSIMSSVYHSSKIKATNSNLFTSPSVCSLAAFSSKSRNLVSFKKLMFPGKSIFVGKRNLCTISAASKRENDSTLDSSFSSEGGQSFFRSVLASMERVYLDRNPTAKSVLEFVHSADGEPIAYDHFAFRTFGLSGHGIDSLASFFLGYGYTQQEELRFPVKKIKALWFSPPRTPLAEGGNGVNGPLPRIFISELLVEQLSPQAQVSILFFRSWTIVLQFSFEDNVCSFCLACLILGLALIT
uniref:2-oxoadipate dioxygenase/decarboxylase n=1 Tax=Rhizophora mucronata TaxID=61149 RepID=A0A2P2M9J3_RHIMU